MLTHEDARNRWLMFTKFVASGVHDDGAVAEWRASLDELDADAKTSGAKFFERCDELEGMGASYAFYRGLSLVSHADGTVPELYHRELPNSTEGSIGVAIASKPAGWAPETVLGLALTYLLLAGMAWDRLDKQHPSRSRLKEIAAEMGMGLDWTQSALGLKRQGEWEREQRQRRLDSQ